MTLTANLDRTKTTVGATGSRATVNSDGRSYSITNGRNGAARAYLSR